MATETTAVETAERTKKPSAEEKLKALRQRIADQLGLTRPPDAAPHCGDCFKRGWIAALKSLED